VKPCAECRVAALCLIGRCLNVWPHENYDLTDGKTYSASTEIVIPGRVLPVYRAIPYKCPRILNPEKERLLP
jgi:hypothetical protein